MKIYVSAPGREIIECDLPTVPACDQSIALDGDGKLHKVVGVVWDLAPPADGISGGSPHEIWVFCEPDSMRPPVWVSNVIPFHKPEDETPSREARQRESDSPPRTR